MADKKITEFDPAGALTGDDIIPLVQDGVNVKSTLALLSAFFGIGDKRATKSYVIEGDGTTGDHVFVFVHALKNFQLVSAVKQYTSPTGPMQQIAVFPSFPDEDTVAVDLSLWDFSIGVSYLLTVQGPDFGDGSVTPSAPTADSTFYTADSTLLTADEL
jgi:hypothetical protein